MSGGGRRAPGGPVIWVLLAALAWYGGFLWRGSAVIGGVRHPCVADDALITLTYARNLNAGHGLDWSRRGEPVEGFTHPLWLGLLLPLVRPELAPARAAWAAPALGLLSLLALLAVTDRCARRRLGLVTPGERALALAAVAGFYPLVYWSLVGMETALAAALVVAATDLALDQLERGADHSVALGALGGAAGLLRLDLLLAWGVLALGLARGPRPGWRRLLAGLGLLALPLVAWQLFRVHYFGDWLPNTYYLKLGGTDPLARLPRGAWTSARFLLALAPLGALAALGARMRLARPARRLLWALAALFPVYALWLGGDAWDHLLPLPANRFQSLGVPLLGLAGAAGAVELARRPLFARARPAVRRLAPAAMIAAALLIGGAAGRPADSTVLLGQLAGSAPPLQCDAGHRWLEQLYAFRRVVPEPATVAVAWAGLPGFYTGYRLFDELGFNDRRIARQAPRVGRTAAEWREFWPGHVKWDEALFLERYRPDAFFQVTSRWGPRAPERLQRAGYRRHRIWWLREDFAAGLAAGSGGAPTR